MNDIEAGGPEGTGFDSPWFVEETVAIIADIVSQEEAGAAILPDPGPDPDYYTTVL